MDIHTYTAIPNTVTKPTLEWRKAVEDSVSQHGVMWVSPRYVGDNPEFPNYKENTTDNNEDNGAQQPKRRRTTSKYLWYVEYKCHRYGSYRDRVAEGTRSKGGVSGNSRDLQKASKKTNCKAKLRVTCEKDSPSVVEITHTGPHNHEVGSIEDLKHLPLSQERKNQIVERLREGYNKRDCRVAIQKDFRKYLRENLLLSDGSIQVIHRDQLVHQDEVYNLFKKIQESSYRKSNDEQQSVCLWLDELRQKGYATFKHSTFNEDFTFGFSSPWQQHLLRNVAMICLDATHCISHIQKAILYTVVVRHPVTGTGCPVAYMYTKDHSMAAITVFLAFLKNEVGVTNLSKITIDVSAAEHAAINAVFPEATVQWCLFHVSRAWMAKIRELVKLGSTALNNQVHREIITDLKALMWEKSQEVFLLSWLAFYNKYDKYEEFISYMDRNYLNREKFVHWSAAYQPQVFSNMETNNYVESWYNQLKTTYFNRKTNRRVDRLVYILVNDVEPDYMQNINRIRLNIGRMGPEERKRRRRELLAASINENILVMMITEPTEESSNTYVVNSFTVENQRYNVEVVNGEMQSCSCNDFQWHRIACKHMYLIRRLHSHISVYQGRLIMFCRNTKKIMY